MTRAELIRAGGAVQRYHVLRTVQRQTNAEHQWGVAMIVEELTGGNASKELIMAAMLHDVAEAVTGDTPYTAKQRSPELSAGLHKLEKAVEEDAGINFALTHDENATLKMADMLELMWYCDGESLLGNTTLDFAWLNGQAVVRKLIYANLELPASRAADRMLAELSARRGRKD